MVKDLSMLNTSMYNIEPVKRYSGELVFSLSASENLEDMILRYYMNGELQSSTTHWCVTRHKSLISEILRVVSKPLLVLEMIINKYRK